jgi:hypothetical protein
MHRLAVGTGTAHGLAIDRLAFEDFATLGLNPPSHAIRFIQRLAVGCHPLLQSRHIQVTQHPAQRRQTWQAAPPGVNSGYV